MPKLTSRPAFSASAAHAVELGLHVRRRLAPGQVLVDLLGRHRVGRLGGAAEVERRVGRLHRREEEAAVLDAEVLAGVFHRLAGEHALVDLEELARDLVALAVAEEEAVAAVLDRVAAGDDVDEQAPVREPVERRGHPRRHGRRLQAGAHRDQEAKPLGQRRQRRGDDPAVLAAASGGQERAVVAERVRRLGDLGEVGQVHRPAALAGAEIAAVAVGRQEPEDLEAFRDGHGGQLQAWYGGLTPFR